jgi:hypothetical protein
MCETALTAFVQVCGVIPDLAVPCDISARQRLRATAYGDGSRPFLYLPQ